MGNMNNCEQRSEQMEKHKVTSLHDVNQSSKIWLGKQIQCMDK